MKHLSLLLCTLLLLTLLPLGLDLPSNDKDAAPQVSFVDQDTVEESTLQMAYSEAIGGDDATYHFQPNGSGYTATNPAHNLSVDVTDSALTVSIGDDTWQLSSDDAATDFTLADNRLTIHRDGFDEWYVNGPVGLQQGFTLHEPAAIVFDVGGTLATTASAQSLSLGDSLTFSGLMAYDADGQDVPVKFELEDNRLAYIYDDGGAEYPLTIDPWVQHAELIADPADRYENAFFGHEVALSRDTAAIAFRWYDCRREDKCQPVYVFKRTGTGWTKQAKLYTGDFTTDYFFGKSLAINGDTILVGASYRCLPSTYCGKVYVFTRTGNTWSQQAQLTAVNTSTGNDFGHDVALDGDSMLIGDDSEGCTGGFNCGSAYVFTRNSGIWTQQAKLIPADISNEDRFGHSVAISGDTALIGTYITDCPGGLYCGAAYISTRSGSTWSQPTRLVTNDDSSDSGFGHSVALSGNTALVGAPQYDCLAGEICGSAYIFTRNGGIWTQQAKLVASDAAPYDHFGQSVALDGNKALIGAPSDDCADGVSCGSGYVFTRDNSIWTQQVKLTADNAQRGAGFGWSIDLSGDIALSGAEGQGCYAGHGCGSAYVIILNPLVTNARCNGQNLEVTISAGDGPFNITASGGMNTPVYGVNFGTTVIPGPEKWTNLTVSETTGGFESINLGKIKCRTDERPVPISPAHRARITNQFPLFTWTGITDANNYRVFVFDDKVAANRTVDIRQNSGGPTQLTLSQALSPDRYFWRVRGRQNRVWSLWSNRVTLFIDPPAIAPLSVSTPAPAIAPNSRATVAPLPTNEPPSDDSPTLPAPPNSR